MSQNSFCIFNLRLRLSSAKQCTLLFFLVLDLKIYYPHMFRNHRKCNSQKERKNAYLHKSVLRGPKPQLDLLVFSKEEKQVYACLSTFSIWEGTYRRMKMLSKFINIICNFLALPLYQSTCKLFVYSILFYFIECKNYSLMPSCRLKTRDN